MRFCYAVLGVPAKPSHSFTKRIAIGEKVLGLGHPRTQRYRSHFARLLVSTERTSKALAFGEAAFATHQAASGSSHPRTKDSARVTADALGRTEDAKALRERYGLTELDEEPKSS